MDLLEFLTGADAPGENACKIVIAVMEKADIQSHIAQRAGVSGATVSKTVKALEQDGYVQHKRPTAGGGGKQLHLGSVFTPAVAVGVDIGFNHVSIVARQVSEDHTRASQVRIEQGASMGFEKLLPLILENLDRVVGQAEPEPGRVLCAGVSVPRMIVPNSNRFTEPVLPPWRAGDNPADAISDHLGGRVPVALGNDANLGALAEHIYREDDPSADKITVFVKASTGVGAGIMVGNQLLLGRAGLAGEIGHLTIRREGRICPCGGRGCLETIVGGEALLAEARVARNEEGEAPHCLRELIELAHRGNAVCRRVLEDAGRHLGMGLAQLCSLLNPHRIVLGGQLAAAGDLVLAPCRETLRQYGLAGAVLAGRKETDLVEPPSLGDWVEAQGALLLGLRSLLEKQPK